MFLNLQRVFSKVIETGKFCLEGVGVEVREAPLLPREVRLECATAYLDILRLLSPYREISEIADALGAMEHVILDANDHQKVDSFFAVRRTLNEVFQAQEGDAIRHDIVAAQGRLGKLWQAFGREADIPGLSSDLHIS